MVAALHRQLDFNLAFSEMLVSDLSEEQMTTIPFLGFENHPSFTLGHLVTGTALMIEDLGGALHIPVGWSELFLRRGPGDPRLPASESRLYPKKEILLNELRNQHEELKKIISSYDIKQFDESIKWRFSVYMPTVLDLTLFMCVNHEAMHLGQLSAWRRAMKLPSALALL